MWRIGLMEGGAVLLSLWLLGWLCVLPCVRLDGRRDGRRTPRAHGAMVARNHTSIPGDELKAYAILPQTKLMPAVVGGPAPGPWQCVGTGRYGYAQPYAL